MKTGQIGWRGRASALLAAAALAACGGGGDGDQGSRVGYGKLVAFGDSLSDVGSYDVGIVAYMQGGKYTVNGSTAKNWTELLAAQAGVAAPCAAQTGLNTDTSVWPAGPVAVVNHTDCTSYAQGGARVTEAVGPGNIALWTVYGQSSGKLGQLTVPVLTQIQNHLAAHGSFSSTDLVTVMAGGNDLFMAMATLQSAVQAGQSLQAAATTAATSMGTAGAQLAGYIKQIILANGATHVVVVNLPDVSVSPYALAYDAATQGLVKTLAQTFNSQLQSGLSGTAGVLVVDSFTALDQQVASPAQYGVTNATTPACDLTGALAALPTSLVCTSATLIAGDTSHYYFADSVHPTPYGYQLLASLVTDAMLKAGWL